MADEEQSEEAESITPENFGDFDIDAYALNKDELGALTFDIAAPQLKALQQQFIEIQELQYQDYLTPEEIQLVDNLISKFIQHLTNLETFDIKQQNASQVHDNFEDQVESFYNTTIKQLRTIVNTLYLNAQRQSDDGKRLAEKEKQLTKLLKEVEESKTKLDKEISDVEKRKEKVQLAHGDLATTQLARHFGEESRINRDLANYWLIAAIIQFALLAIILGTNVVLLILKKGPYTTLDPEYLYYFGAGKLALVLLLWYGLSFAVRNYLALSNLKAVNKHRRNVAQTLEDSLRADTDPDTRSTMLTTGVTEMFRHMPTGYLKKDGEKGVSSPVQEIITNVLPKSE